MIITIPNVLDADQLREARSELDKAQWVDGRVTAGHQSARAKDNEQLPEDSPLARQLGSMVLAALERIAALYFRSAATEGLSAAVQPLHGWPVLWPACGQRGAPDSRHAAAGAD